ncbi:MAG: cytochrome c maturation protein CcmE [Nitrospirae bacterium]|nr:cytochrome c maturation protein CcmE [Nitrospirota bacterium]
MTGLYLRWSALVIAAVVIAALASRYFEQNLTSLTPEEIVSLQPTRVVRVIGLVKGGTLRGDLDSGHASFELAGRQEALPVEYDGPPPENLRELKTLVVIGSLDPSSGTFLAHELALVTNYGYVVGAYLIGLLPLAIFLFGMERKVTFLYREIKESKLYEPETAHHVDTR